MTIADLVIFLFLSMATGLVGGLIGALGLWLLARNYRPQMLEPVDLVLQARVDPISFKLNVPPPPLVTIPVETAPISLIEFGRKVLAEAPDIGPRRLGRILGCSAAMAQGIINDFRNEQPADSGNPQGANGSGAHP